MANMEEIKEKIDELKEKASVRYGIGALIIIAIVAYLVMGREKTDLSALTEVAPTSVFIGEGVDQEIRDYEIGDYVESLERRFKDKEKEFDEKDMLRQSEMTRMQEENQQLKDAVFQLSNNMRVLMNNQDELEVTRNNGTPLQNNDQLLINNGTPNQMSPSMQVQNQPQMQTFTGAPAVFGKNVIRTVSQRRIMEVDGRGDVAVRDTGLRTVSERDRIVLDETLASQQAERDREQEVFEEESNKFILASGSIMSAVLLNGVAAPTGNAGSSEPIPVLARVKKEAIMPNFFSLDIRECHIVGSASGRLRDRRGYIRTDHISCITADGKVLENRLSAVAVSKGDGMVGIPGTLVFTGSEMLENSAYAGFLSGFSQAISPRQVNAINTDPGANQLWQSQNFSNYGAAGVGQGMSSAMDRLANYYLELAEQTVPVIELLPGIEVDFIITAPTTFDISKAQ